MARNIEPFSMPRDLITVREVAEATGHAVSTVYDWIHSGKLRAIRIVGSYRIERSELQRLLGGETESRLSRRQMKRMERTRTSDPYGVIAEAKRKGNPS
jgi:excisionase family DNA binding protein